MLQFPQATPALPFLFQQKSQKNRSNSDHSYLYHRHHIRNRVSIVVNSSLIQGTIQNNTIIRPARLSRNACSSLPLCLRIWLSTATTIPSAAILKSNCYTHTLKVPFLRLYTRRMIITTPVSIPTGRYTRCFFKKSSNRDSARNFSSVFCRFHCIADSLHCFRHKMLPAADVRISQALLPDLQFSFVLLQTILPDFLPAWILMVAHTYTDLIQKCLHGCICRFIKRQKIVQPHVFLFQCISPAHKQAYPFPRHPLSCFFPLCPLYKNPAHPASIRTVPKILATMDFLLPHIQ